MKDHSLVGDLINFRGLVYSPINENGVIFLFGKVTKDLNMYIEEIKPGFPDCIARRFTGRGWEKVSIEFEYKSGAFVEHKHDVNDCDIIVCWEHDWADCPLEVIELRDVIKSLPNFPIERPGVEKAGEPKKLEECLKKVSKEVAILFNKFKENVESFNPDIWVKATKWPGATFYSPERVFIYLNLRKSGFTLDIFTRGKKLEGVKNISSSGGKWGSVKVLSEADMNRVLPIVKRSYELIKEAIKNNEPTGWYAKIETGEEEEEEVS